MKTPLRVELWLEGLGSAGSGAHSFQFPASCSSYQNSRFSDWGCLGPRMSIKILMDKVSADSFKGHIPAAGQLSISSPEADLLDAVVSLAFHLPLSQLPLLQLQ